MGRVAHGFNFILNIPKGLYHKGRLYNRKTQALEPFAAQTDGHPQERKGRTNGTGNEKHRRRNILPLPMTLKNAGGFFQNHFKKGSALPPHFLPLVEGHNRKWGLSDYALNKQERSITNALYTISTQKTITKGANTMQTVLTSGKTTRRGAGAADFKKRIGSTVYAVSVHFSRTSRETIEDKILKLIESEARKTA